MMIKQNFTSHLAKLILSLILAAPLFQCSEDDEIITVVEKKEPEPEETPDPAPAVQSPRDCSACTYVVPPNQHKIDGKVLGIKPGDVIGLNADTKYGTLTFDNIEGSAEKPVIVTNCGGTARVHAPDKHYSIRFINSKFFRITGGDTPETYGIVLTGASSMGLNLGQHTTNFEVDHLEIYDIGFAGIMAKTDPSCDESTVRGKYTMRDVSFHHNYVHDTKGEGLYIGNSFYNGRETPCGIRFPHDIENLKVHDNIVRNTGWDGIQIGCATVGAEIHHNVVENYATRKVQSQNAGIQINPGTGGVCHSNLVRNGFGPGIVVLGLADNLLYNNIVVNPETIGFFCDERTKPGAGYRFINNTVINPKKEGFLLYSEEVPMNILFNNLVVNPGSTAQGDLAYVRTSSTVKLEKSNNYFTKDISAVKFVNAGALDFNITANSPVVDKGKDISKFNIEKDFYKNERLKGKAYDIGATEF